MPKQQARREYWLRLTINGIRYRRVVIDPHYEKKHRESMSDEIILSLVRRLHGKAFRAQVTLESGYRIFVNDPWFLEDKAYRLIWTTHPDKDYVGVVNAFRRPYGKKK